jgi:uncharacterized protein (TIGR02679 family)
MTPAMTNKGDPGRFQAAEYRRLLAAARRSLERTGGDLNGAVSIDSPDGAERKAIIGITGQYRPEGTSRITVRLADLDAAVREATGRTLAQLLGELGPPLRDLPRERERLSAGREATVRSSEESFLHALDWYQAWLGQITRDGTLTRLVNAGEAARVGQAVRVLEALARRAEPVQLAELAAGVTGDTKALNPGPGRATGVRRALALRAAGAGRAAGRAATTEQRRELWDACGVIVDDLASRVLVLNLPAAGTGLGEWLSSAAALGVPFYATLQQLVVLPVAVRGPLVRVCENPAVLRRAAADLGASSAPLLCTEGQPSTAFHRLASAVTRGGGELRYHGDFDWPGVAIAASVMSRHGARPWRMSAADYAAGARAEGDYVPLSGTPQPTPWDPALAAAMTAAGRAVYEEAVADALIADLAG